MDQTLKLSFRAQREIFNNGKISQSLRAFEMTVLPIKPLVLTCCFLLSLWGCSDANLRAKDVTIHLTGRYCTDSSSQFQAPLRLVIVCDSSESNKQTDPTKQRVAAAIELITTLLAKKDADIKFGVIAFDTGSRQVTPEFSNNKDDLIAALQECGKEQGFTNYLDALNKLDDMIDQDAAKVEKELTDLEAQGQDTQYLRPYYIGLFESDGQPRLASTSTPQTPEQILRAVDRVMDPRSSAVLGVTLNAAYLGAGTSDSAAKDRDNAVSLLKDMVGPDHGKGNFVEFEKGQKIDFKQFDFQIKRLFSIKQFYVYNENTIYYNGRLAVDSDGDALADDQEPEFGTNPVNRDTDGDGLGDGYEVITQLKPLVTNFLCKGLDYKNDTDKDGLTDCEEKFLNFDSLRFDTDGDLLHDGFETYHGLNAGDASDAERNLDFDEMLAGPEIIRARSPKANEGAALKFIEYDYKPLEQAPPEEGATSSDCWFFDVGNITLGNTLETADHGAGENRIHVIGIQSPTDAPEKKFMWNRLLLKLYYSDYRISDNNIYIDGRDFTFELMGQQDAKKK